ncbi:MAG TPA: ABC transporter, partial [Blastocatellia bacterium]|nr:ABC transporter [Blastocatellia bacterium]
FAANQSAQFPPNANLFMNSINWLAQDEDLISIRPKNPEDRRVTMTASQQNILFWLSIVLMPGAVIASGVYIWWKRR